MDCRLLRKIEEKQRIVMTKKQKKKSKHSLLNGCFDLYLRSFIKNETHIELIKLAVEMFILNRTSIGELIKPLQFKAKIYETQYGKFLYLGSEYGYRIISTSGEKPILYIGKHRKICSSTKEAKHIANAVHRERIMQLFDI